MKTKLSGLLGGMILVFTGVASASTSFNFTALNVSPSSTSSIPNQSLGGITVSEIAAWANVNVSGSTVTGTSNKFVASGTGQNNQPWIGEYAGNGLGVCSQPEQPACSYPVHQIDNLNGTEFVLFGFNAAVSLNDVQVQSYGNPTGSGNEYIDMSYAILSSSQEASLLAGTLVFSSVNFTTETTGSTSSSFDYNLTGTGQYVLIGTAVTAKYGGNTGGTPDAFKIQDLTVSAIGTPEPATFLLVGSGLLAAAFFRRRSIRAVSSL